jgi:hypothetical protein
MAALIVPAALEHVDEAHDVSVDIGVWIDQGVAYSRFDRLLLSGRRRSRVQGVLHDFSARRLM